MVTIHDSVSWNRLQTRNSYWNIIDDPENIKDITQKDINSQWYIQMLNAINKGEY